MNKAKYFCLSLLLFLSLCPSSLLLAEVKTSTATGNRIEYDNIGGTAHIKGEAVVLTSTATLKADQIKLNTQKKQGQAEGSVQVIQGSATIRGDKAIYNWESSTGVFYGAEGADPPWRFSGKKVTQMDRGIYRFQRGLITSCEHDPPHYWIRSSRSKVRSGKRALLKNAHFKLGETSVLWTPFYTRSLIPKRYTLRVQPGASSRDGITNRTTLGYPFSKYSHTRFKWDYLQQTGNGWGIEHRYFHPRIKGNLDSYFIRDINSDPQPKSRRFTVLWNHFQKITDKLTMNSKLDLKSDQTFGNEFSDLGNQTRVENSARGVFSEGGFRYQFSKATLQLQADRRDKFDQTISSSNFISKLTVPKVTFNTIPIKWKHFPFYTSFTGNWINETLARSDPDKALRYQRSATAGVQIKKDFRIQKKWTLTPRMGFDERWQDRDLTKTEAENDIYNGRYNLGMDVRRKISRNVDTTVKHDYVARLEQNRINMDTKANDRGIERNLITGSVVTRVGRSTRLTLASGYDLRSPPKSDPDFYIHTSRRIVSPSLDAQIQLTRSLGLYFRETYSLFDNSTLRPTRTPANTAGEIQIGDFTSSTFFSHGFSYTKSASGVDASVTFTNKLKFFLTKHWHVNAFLSYRAEGPKKLNYRKVKPVEKTIEVVRDLHCWVLRMSFSDRTGIREASFHIDLKTNLKSQEDLYEKSKDIPFYTNREDTDENYELFLGPQELGADEETETKESSL